MALALLRFSDAPSAFRMGVAKTMLDEQRHLQSYIGKMHELGESEAAEHLRVGRLASEIGIDHLVAIGTDLYLNGLELDFEAGDEMLTHYFLTQEEALGLSKHFSDGDVVLVKASRAEHLDELSEKLIARTQLREVGMGPSE